jgi:Cysteine-rich secretory protein family
MNAGGKRRKSGMLEYVSRRALLVSSSLLSAGALLPVTRKGFVIFITALVGSSAVSAKSDCGMMQKLAQEHSSSMARRNSLNHASFENRARRGARAENVAFGYSTRAATIAQWWRSPAHAANMRLPGCKEVASAVSRSGRRYWMMEIDR